MTKKNLKIISEDDDDDDGDADDEEDGKHEITMTTMMKI